MTETPFVPAHGGGEAETLGFVQAALDDGLVAALVVPTDADPGRYGRTDDIDALRRLVHPVPTFLAARNRSLRAGLRPWRPYVVGSRPPPKGIVPRLRELAPDATGVVIFSYKSHYLGRTIARQLGLPCVLRMHNLEGRYHRALAASARGHRSLALWIEAARIEVDERRLERASWLRGIADISTTDASVRVRRGAKRVTYVPTFAFGSRGQPCPGERVAVAPEPTVVFLGALDVETNYDAVEWFASQVWPSVVTEVPVARWQVVGRSPVPRLRQLLDAVPNVEIHADVDEPAAYLRRATLAVNPAVSGSGVNMKLVEYLTLGVPVVSTRLGMQGVGLSPDEHLATEDDPARFAARVVELLRCPERAASLGLAGREGIADVLDTRRNLAVLKALLNLPAPPDAPALGR